MKHSKWIIVFLFLTGFLLRLIFIPNPGFEADVSFWKSWGLAPFDHGIVWGAHNTNFNYPMPFMYLLWAMVKVYSFFADPHNFDAFWNNHNLLFLTICKLPTILADLGIAALLVLIGRKPKRFSFPDLPFSIYLTLSALYLFSPLALIDGPLWGQIDALGVIIFLVAIMLTIKQKPLLAGIIYMVAMMTKLQNMIYGPLFFLFVYQMMGVKGLVKAIAGSLFTFLGLNAEFILAQDMKRVIASLTENYDYFPLLSLNAYNFWWIVASGKGMEISDKINFLGLLNAKKVGLFLFSSGYLLSLLTMAKETVKSWGKPTKDGAAQTIMSFFIALVIANASFFLFQTESHDRYAFPIAIFSLFLAPFLIHSFTTVKKRIKWWTTIPWKCFIFVYILYTCLYFINLHTALIINYPENGIPLLFSLQNPTVTITLAVILIGFFIFFILSLRNVIGIIPIIVSLLVFIILSTASNLPLILHKPISLTAFTPVKATQDYARMTIDMPTNAYEGYKKWDRLSVQYGFYKKGIGTHAKSEIVYDIGRRFKTFATDYGVDTEAGLQGSITFEIWGDNTLLFRSDTIKRFDNPRHIEVDVTGVKELKLFVGDAGNGNTDDHADWLNPTLYPL